MRDRLNKLEKLGYPDLDPWLQWREARNRLAHKYPDAPELRFAAIRGAIEAAKHLTETCNRWKEKLRSEGLLDSAND